MGRGREIYGGNKEKQIEDREVKGERFKRYKKIKMENGDKQIKLGQPVLHKKFRR